MVWKDGTHASWPTAQVPAEFVHAEFMQKDSAKYASTGGWGFAQFDEGKPASEAVHRTCYPCHAIVEARDLVFNRYAP